MNVSGFDEIIRRNEEYKLHIVNQVMTDRIEIWLIRKSGDKVFVLSVVEGGLLQEKELPEGGFLEGEYKPLMILPRKVWGLFKEAVFNKENPPEKQAVDAELKATKAHLSDMRRLVFESERVEIRQEEKPIIHMPREEKS